MMITNAGVVFDVTSLVQKHDSFPLYHRIHCHKNNGHSFEN
jgi:hypothetical protein